MLISVLFVNALTTDFDFNVLDQDVAQPVEPAEGLFCANGYLGQLHAQVYAVDQITVTGHGASYFLAEVPGAVDTLSQWFPKRGGLYLKLKEPRFLKNLLSQKILKERWP